MRCCSRMAGDCGDLGDGADMLFEAPCEEAGVFGGRGGAAIGYLIESRGSGDKLDGGEALWLKACCRGAAGAVVADVADGRGCEKGVLLK